jgi:hypothetical protein
MNAEAGLDAAGYNTEVARPAVAPYPASPFCYREESLF